MSKAATDYYLWRTPIFTLLAWETGRDKGKAAGRYQTQVRIY
jgi:hypothetical protein